MMEAAHRHFSLSRALKIYFYCLLSRSTRWLKDIFIRCDWRREREIDTNVCAHNFVFLFRSNDDKMLISYDEWKDTFSFLWSGAIELKKRDEKLNWILLSLFLSFLATPIDPSKDFTVDGINGFSNKKKKKKRRHRWA